MKIRTDFVTNSSSSSFIITNKSHEAKTLVDFVQENPQLIIEYIIEYGHLKDSLFTQESLINSADHNCIYFPPLSSEECVFGDEDGTLIGRVFDYILRDGGESENFKWHYHESLR